MSILRNEKVMLHLYRKLLTCVFTIFSLLLSPTLLSASCTVPDRNIWFIKATDKSSGNGSIWLPLNNTELLNQCTKVNDRIVVLPSHKPLLGNIILKDGQKLQGVPKIGKYKVIKRKFILEYPKLSNPEGTAITLADNVVVQKLHIVNSGKASESQGDPAFSMIAGLNVENLKLKRLKLSHGEGSSRIAAIKIDVFNPEAVLNFSLKDLTIISEGDLTSIYNNAQIVNGGFFPDVLGSGLEIFAPQVQSANIKMRNVDILNARSGIRAQILGSIEPVNYRLSKVTVINASSDVISFVQNAGEVKAKLNKVNIKRERVLVDAVDAVADQLNPFGLAFASGISFFSFGFNKPELSQLIIRNSKILNISGPGVVIGHPGENLVVDLGCTESKSECADLNLLPSAGNNLISGNGFYYPQVFGPPLTDTFGGTTELSIAANPNSQPVYAQGNNWGPGVSLKGNGEECSVTITPVDPQNPLPYEVANTDKIDDWRCTIDTTFFGGAFLEPAAQPVD